jgi:transcriptional regulator with GAF, ATPase, and Fis domain
MPARLTAYVPDQAAASCLLRPPQRLVVGRGDDCDFRLVHASVSRRHAELWRDGDHWRVIDLGSKNGTFLAGARIGSVRLDRAGWLRFGDVHCEFEPLTAETAAAIEQRIAQRHADSQLMVARLQAQTSLPDLLAETVRAAVELAACERGFLLLETAGSLRVAASHGIDAQAMQSRQFTGSAGAIERALRSGAPVVLNDVAADADLASRLSVVAGGLRSLLCIPLLLDGQCLGLLYTDSRTPGAPITAIDLDLLAAFAERAIVWIAARRGVADLDALLAAPAPAWQDVLSAQQMAAA